jgi:LPS export ABC transporter protein LptC
MQQQFWQRIRFIRWLLFLAMAGAVLAVFVGLKVRSSKHILPAVVTKAASNDGSLSLNNFEYRDVKEGTARWTVWATTATYFKDRQETLLDQVKALFFLKNGGQVLLTGDRGVLHNDTQNMEISGNVKVSYGERYRLSTDRLLYNRDEELIHTVLPILLEGEGIILKGQGMRLEIEKRTLSVLNHIETTLEGIVSFGEKRRGVS